jgi:lactose/L-arabinose transport system substrate-binding protein
MFFNQLGGNYATPEGKIALKSEQAKQSLTLFKKMADEGIAIDIKDWNGRITALKNNKIASVIYPVWFAGTLMNSVADQKGKWSIMPLPAFSKGGDNQANLGGSVLALTKQSKNQDAAWKFIEYCLATDEGQTVMLQYGLFPSYTPFYDNPIFKANNEYFDMPIYQFFATQAEKIKPLHRGPIMLDATKPLTDMESAVLSGTSIDEAMNAAAQEIAVKSGQVSQ